MATQELSQFWMKKWKCIQDLLSFIIANGKHSKQGLKSFRNLSPILGVELNLPLISTYNTRLLRRLANLSIYDERTLQIKPSLRLNAHFVFNPPNNIQNIMILLWYTLISEWSMNRSAFELIWFTMIHGSWLQKSESDPPMIHGTVRLPNGSDPSNDPWSVRF